MTTMVDAPRRRRRPRGRWDEVWSTLVSGCPGRHARTLGSIARELGITAGTVSRALSGSPDVSVVMTLRVLVAIGATRDVQAACLALLGAGADEVGRVARGGAS